MSNENQETIADIVAEMRGPYYKMGRSNASLDKQMMDYMSFMANRIETAAKQSVADCNHLGNAAKMREALKETQSVIAKCMEILNRIPDGVEYDGLIDEVADELCDLRDSHVKPALSTSQRFQGKLLPRKIACNRCRTSR